MKNKKTLVIAIVAVVLVVAVVLGVVLLGGGNNTDGSTTTTKPAGSTGAEETYKLGMGVHVAADGHKNTEANATIATVVLDSNGKIVACRIDVAQNKYTINADEGTFTFEKYGTDGKPADNGDFQTKMERGDGYGMAGKVDNDGNGVKLEWNKQVLAFEEHVIGMTGNEVANMKTQLVNNHYITTDSDLLAAGCSIQITDFVAAVSKACKDDGAVEFKSASKNFKLGVAAKTSDNGSKFENGDEVACQIALNVDFGAAVVDANGKILAALNDAYQPVISIGWENNNVISANVGKTDLTTKEDLGLMTKRELKENYAMAGKVDNDGNGVKLEWYKQSAAFSAHVVGMTATQVKSMGTSLVNNHYISTDKDLLNAGCPMQITGLMAVVSQAATNAR